MKQVLIMVLGALHLMSASGAEVNFHSLPARTALVELFTSEGCSSCPPAEAWLSDLKDSPKLWRGVVPVAFHVDYWDELGWRDAWAKSEFTDRQRTYAAQWHSDSIYTPGMVLNGKEWRLWRLSGAPDAGTDPVGILELSSTNGTHWQVRFRPIGKIEGRLEAQVALLGSGISSSVKAGENSGRKLAHDFIALALRHAPLTAQDGLFTGEVVLPASIAAPSGRLAVAGWVNAVRTGELLQATGGWLPMK